MGGALAARTAMVRRDIQVVEIKFFKNPGFGHVSIQISIPGFGCSNVLILIQGHLQNG